MLDSRYSTIKVLIESGHIKSFPDIFQYIPKTTVYRDLGVNFNRFSNAIFDPSQFRMNELLNLADMLEMDPKKIIDMAYEQIVTMKMAKRKTW